MTQCSWNGWWWCLWDIVNVLNTTELDTWKWLEWWTSCYVHFSSILKKKEISINLECYGCMSPPGLPCQARRLWDNAWWGGGRWPGKSRAWGSRGWTTEVCHNLAKKLLRSVLKFCWREAAESCRPPRFEMLSRVCTHFLWLMWAGACLSWLQLDWRQALPCFGRKLLKLLPRHLLHLPWQQQASWETDWGLGSRESHASFSFSLVVL